MKLALGIEYDGSRYFGWQRQEEVESVQQRLEAALSMVAAAPVEVFCAGRTDSGVHATGQVVHFETQAERPLKSWCFGTNAHLPDDIAVKWAVETPDEFHARFSAIARRYRYVIFNDKLRSAILPQGVSHYHYPLDAAKMHKAGQFLLGENDFSAFRAAKCQSHSPWRNLHHLKVSRLGKYVIVDIQANAFVHHMVRNIVGSLLEVGQGRKPIEWLKVLLDGRDRRLAAPTAKAEGLYLVEVQYPERFGIPKTAPGPLFLGDE